MLDGRRHTGRASGWRKLSALECSPLLSLCQPDGHGDGDADHFNLNLKRYFMTVIMIFVTSDECSPLLSLCQPGGHGDMVTW